MLEVTLLQASPGAQSDGDVNCRLRLCPAAGLSSYNRRLTESLGLEGTF